MGQSSYKRGAFSFSQWAARFIRRVVLILIPMLGLFLAMAIHSALLTGVFELVIIIIVGVWISLFFKERYSYPKEGKDPTKKSYLERDREYLEEQMDTYQREREDQHQA